MFKHLPQGLLAGLAIKLLGNCRHLSIQVLKIEAAWARGSAAEVVLGYEKEERMES